MNNISVCYNLKSGAEEARLSCHFISDIFHLSREVLSEAEVRGLEKDLDFAPVQKQNQLI